jgi:hypothetical protein
MTMGIGATLACLVALIVGALVLDLDVGLTAVTLAVLLAIIWPEISKKAVGEITWPTVLLICGVLRYVGVLQKMGTIDYAGAAVSKVGIPLLAALLICYIGAIVSAFASSVGIMGRADPAGGPVPRAGDRQSDRHDRRAGHRRDSRRRQSIQYQWRTRPRQCPDR